MTHQEVIQAILDRKSLQARSSNGAWLHWCTDGGWSSTDDDDRPLTDVLKFYLTRVHKEFRLKPEVVTYHTRDYAMMTEGKLRVFTWHEWYSGTQSERERVPTSQGFRWLGPTVTKTYEVTE